MVFNIIFSIISQLFSKNINFSKLAHDSKQNLTVVIQEQTKIILVSLISAVALGSVIVCSVLALIDKINIYMMTLENGFAFSVLFFVVLILISVGLTFVLFRPKKVIGSPLESAPEPINLQSMILLFAESFSKAYKDKNTQP